MRYLGAMGIRQREFITHTFIYYELDETVWSDAKYDEEAGELESYKTLSIRWQHTLYYEIFKDWTSVTGRGLIQKDNEEHYEFFMRQAKNALEAHQDYLDTL